MCCALVYGSIKKFPLIQIEGDTPYCTGVIEDMCIESPIHDLIIGNLPGATTEENPAWQTKESTALAVTTRAQDQSKRSLSSY